MNDGQFNDLCDITMLKMRDILSAKGKDYSQTHDRLSNFKENAARLGTEPMQIWAVYFMKHVDAILSYVRTGVVHSEPIDGRFLDALNYLILGLGLIKEKDHLPCQPMNK